MFIGREKELSKLEECYRLPGVNTCCVYGRRQVGKSTLLKEFAKDKRHFYIQFNEESLYECIARFQLALRNHFGIEMPMSTPFTTMMAALADECRKEKTVIIIDEYPYIVDAYPSFPSILQAFIDTDLAGADALVIICGSSISVMLDETTNYSRPLYQRFSRKMLVQPLSFLKCMEFHRNMSDIDAIKTYLAVGGIPKYHVMMDSDTFEEAFIKCFTGTGDLLNEGEQVVKADLSPSSPYTGIVTCIADGRNNIKEIKEAMGIEDSSQCRRMVERLVDLFIVRKVEPMLGAPMRPVRYAIEDNIVDFHYSVLRKFDDLRTSLHINPDTVLRVMRSEIDTFMGHSFERLCRDYIRVHRDATAIGTWWSPREGSTDIDVVAKVIGRDLRTGYLLAECKFRRKETRMDVMQDLLDRAKQTKGLVNPEYMIISVSGFAPNLREYAEDNGVALIGLDELLERGGDNPAPRSLVLQLDAEGLLVVRGVPVPPASDRGLAVLYGPLGTHLDASHAHGALLLVPDRPPVVEHDDPLRADLGADLALDAPVGQCEGLGHAHLVVLPVELPPVAVALVGAPVAGVPCLERVDDGRDLGIRRLQNLFRLLLRGHLEREHGVVRHEDVVGDVDLQTVAELLAEHLACAPGFSAACGDAEHPAGIPDDDVPGELQDHRRKAAVVGGEDESDVRALGVERVPLVPDGGGDVHKTRSQCLGGTEGYRIRVPGSREDEDHAKSVGFMGYKGMRQKLTTLISLKAG